MSVREADLMALMALPAFRAFLYEAIQMAGICDPANGLDPRDLAFQEGRRSLGLDLLRLADGGQPAPLRTPQALATLNALLITALNPAPEPKEKRRAQSRYDEIPE